jgi:hypothetical protein
MPGSDVSNRRFAARAAIVAALVVLAFAMYNIGKEYNVLLDNKTVSIDGVEYPMLETVSLTLDGVKKNDVKADARAAHKMVGKSHKIKIDVLRGDKSVEKTVERTVKFSMNMRAWMISLPALAGGAKNIYVPSPVTAPPASTPPAEPQGPSAPEEAIEETMSEF